MKAEEETKLETGKKKIREEGKEENDTVIVKKKVYQFCFD